ncbi:hypothetical protein M768_00770 [Cellulosimicrobium cellulans F16]|uniref:Uncharacterized protein n=1 Tax=Cellulosimicrobium cellulans F16 TaxID=1350482 RepID=A0A0M0FA79_CELCE|nr:hypothetical protein [Cellulosimicrobium cellulans]KON74490.1 hypothetical protein M768_00770 [Cellulosimicrobium cellulans F16]
MSPANGSPAPAPPEDDFLARLRRTADDAVPPSTLDLDVVLRSSRRGVQRRRSLAGVAGVVALGLVSTGVVTAGGPDGLRELAREVVSGSPGYEVLISEPMVAGVVPGVVALLEPASYLRDDGTYILDLGLGAWRPGERFFVEFGPSESLPELRVVAGDDDDLAALRRGDPAGTVVHEGYSSIVLIQRKNGEESLFLSVEPSTFSVGTDPGYERSRRESWMILAGDEPGATGSTVPLPDAWADGLFLQAAVLGRDGVPTADLRGVLTAMTAHNGSSMGVLTCGSPLRDSEQDPRCRSSYDPETREVVPVDTPLAVLDRSVVDRLLPIASTDGELFDVERELQTCLSVRGAEVSVLSDPWETDPEGVDGDAWRQCLFDASLVRSARTFEAFSSVKPDS